ncbi:hypothetical protein BDV12DRAFT_203064 [Aspergillus spectabilis]
MPSFIVSPPSVAFDNVKSGRNYGLAGCFYNNARANPHNTAVDFGGRKLSIGELHCHGLAVSRWLISQGLKPEEAVGIITESGFEQIIAQVGIIYAGGTVCGSDPSLLDVQVHSRLVNAGARVCLVDQKHSSRLAAYDYLVLSISSDPLTSTDIEKGLAYIPPRVLGPEQRCHLMHTSGSTGKPKAVQIQAQGIINLANDDKSVPTDHLDRVAQICMVSFDLSMFEIWVTLLRGATIIPIPRAMLQDVFRLSRALIDLAVTVMLVPAALLPTLVLAMPTVFAKMNVVYSGGEMPNLPAIQQVLLKGAPKHLFNGYGPTECCIFSLLREITLQDTKRGAAPLNQGVGNTQVMILDDNLQPVTEPGQPGELFLGGDGVSPGYLNLPEKTAERFVGHEKIRALDPSYNWFATGDLVRRDEAGDIHTLGRKDNQVKIRGFRIELEGVDVALLETGLFAGVASCKVQRDENDHMNATLVAFVVPKSRQTFQAKKVIEILETRLPDYMVPQLEICDKLPLNGHSKVDRPKLVAEFLTRASYTTDEPLEDSDSTLGRLRAVWHRVLPSYSKPIRDDDDFTTLGGSSLQAAMLLIRVKQEFGIQLTAIDVYEHPTLAAMAHRVDTGSKTFKLDTAQNQQFRKDSDLFASLGLSPPSTPPVQWHWPSEGHVFVTGATGFLGAFALHGLLTQPEVKSVVCLVRGSSGQEARSRLMAVQSQYALDTDLALYKSKLQVVAGSLEEPNLGLSSAEFQRLGERTSAIFHMAAHVNYAEPYIHHRQANVLGTATLLQLQITGRSKRLHYTSSISVYGPTGLIDGTTYLGENDSPMKYVNAVQYDNGYAQSKWVSEKLVVDASDAGFPITIYRPGSVFCHTATGVGNATDFNSRLMTSCLRMRAFPDMPRQSKNFIPVNYLVETMICLSKAEDTIGQGFNMVPGMPKLPDNDLNETFHMLEEATGVKLEKLPYAQWLAKVKEQADNDPLRPLLPMLDEAVYKGLCRWQMYENMPIYGTDNLRLFLKKHEPRLEKCPVVDLKLLTKFLGYLEVL